MWFQLEAGFSLVPQEALVRELNHRDVLYREAEGARFMILISVNHWLMAIPDNEGRQFWGRMYNLPGRFAFIELKETLQWKPLSL